MIPELQLLGMHGLILNIPPAAIHLGSSSAKKWVGATTRQKNEKMKIVVTFKQPRNTARPVPA